MNRREFSKTLAAAATLPALPVKFAAAAPAAAAARFQYGMDPYMWAKYTARINGHLSPDLLRTALGFERIESKSMIARLVRENILNAPDAMGVCQTSADYLTSFKRSRTVAKAATDVQKAMREKIDEQAKSIIDDVQTEDASQQEETPSTADNSQPA